MEVPPSQPPKVHTVHPMHALDAAAIEAAELELTEGEMGPWRELWYGSLDALHREPTINNTHEDVLVQLGAVAFLHCPVRNLGERGVRTFKLLLRSLSESLISFLQYNTWLHRCRGCAAGIGT